MEVGDPAGTPLSTWQTTRRHRQEDSNPDINRHSPTPSHEVKNMRSFSYTPNSWYYTYVQE
jgi:cytochrome oxidase assembly protein ShyY1